MNYFDHVNIEDKTPLHSSPLFFYHFFSSLFLWFVTLAYCILSKAWISNFILQQTSTPSEPPYLRGYNSSCKWDGSWRKPINWSGSWGKDGGTLNFCHIYAFYFYFLFVFCLFYNQGLVSLRVSQTDMNDKEDAKKTISCRILSHVLNSQS